MSDQSFIKGFVKRAGDYGINETAAYRLAKQAFFAKAKEMAGNAMNSIGGAVSNMFAPAAPDFPPEGQPGGRPGGTGGVTSPLPPGMGQPAGPSAMQPSYGIGQGRFNPMFNPMAPQAVNNATQEQFKNIQPPAPAPQPQQPDLQSEFAKYHGTAYNPQSKMDQWKLQQMQQAQQSGGSIVQAANKRYPGRV